MTNHQKEKPLPEIRRGCVGILGASSYLSSLHGTIAVQQAGISTFRSRASRHRTVGCCGFIGPNTLPLSIRTIFNCRGEIVGRYGGVSREQRPEAGAFCFEILGLW